MVLGDQERERACDSMNVVLTEMLTRRDLSHAHVQARDSFSRRTSLSSPPATRCKLLPLFFLPELRASVVEEQVNDLPQFALRWRLHPDLDHRH